MSASDFFAVNPEAFAPFMRDRIEVRSACGVKSLAASVLLVQRDASALSDMTGDAFAVQFMLRDWPFDDLPEKGSVVTFGHPARKLFVTSAQVVGGIVHLKCHENLGY